MVDSRVFIFTTQDRSRMANKDHRNRRWFNCIEGDQAIAGKVMSSMIDAKGYVPNRDIYLQILLRSLLASSFIQCVDSEKNNLDHDENENE